MRNLKKHINFMLLTTAVLVLLIHSIVPHHHHDQPESHIETHCWNSNSSQNLLFDTFHLNFSHQHSPEAITWCNFSNHWLQQKYEFPVFLTTNTLCINPENESLKEELRIFTDHIRTYRIKYSENRRAPPVQNTIS